MKKYILAAFVALAFAPAVSAQEYTTIDGFIKYKYGQSAKMEFPRDFGVDMPTGKSFGYSKNISKPFNDGTYFIKLESFATGTADVKDRASDIVLVLDVSGSMNTNYTTNVHEPLIIKMPVIQLAPMTTTIVATLMQHRITGVMFVIRVSII